MPNLEEKYVLMMCNLPVSVYKSVESKSISPAGGEILNVDLRVPEMNRQNKIKLQWAFVFIGCTLQREIRQFPAFNSLSCWNFLKIGAKTCSSRSQASVLSKSVLKSQWNGLGLVSVPEFFSACSPCSLHLAPEQQSILGRAGLSVVFRLYFDHLDLNENGHIFSRDTVAQILRRGRRHRLVRQSWMISKYLKARLSILKINKESNLSWNRIWIAELTPIKSTPK